MKKISAVVLLSAFICAGCGKSADILSENKQHITSEVSVYEETDDVLAKTDYPLIDMYFDSDDDWTVVIRDDYSGEEAESVWIAQNQDKLNNNKEYIRVETFPVGRGTTPQGYVYVYKNNELVKSVPYVNIEFGNEELKDIFFKCTTEQLSQQLDITLPSVI